METPAPKRWRDLLALGLATWLLAACGGGGDGGTRQPSTTDGPGDGDPVGITLDAPQAVDGTNRIALTWQTQGAPTSFTVFVQRFAGDAFLAVGDATIGDGAAQFARGAAWRYDWPTARVRVRACTAQQSCADSNEQPLLGALEAGVVTLRADPLPASSGYVASFDFSSDGSTVGIGTAPLSMFLRGNDGRWSQDRSAPARSGGRSAVSGDGRTLAIGLPLHRGTVGGVGAPEEEPPPDADPSTSAGNRGAVAVYVRDAAGAWQQQTFIKADEPVDGALFGLSVALSGDGNRLVVGAAGGPNVGDVSVSVYEREGGAWRLAWTFANRAFRRLQAGALAVSADGRTIAVPVYGWTVIDNPGGYGDGDEVPYSFVHVYRQCACQERWELAAEFQSQRPTRDPRGPDDRYGQALSLSADGKTLAVGAPDDSGGAGDDGIGPNEGSFRSGALYVYGEGADRRWQRRAFIKTPTAPPQDFLGGSVQLRADGRALVANACGLVANAPGVRRMHRAQALPPAPMDCSDGSNFYVFEEDAEGSWKHTAAALVPNALSNGAQVRASADLETIGATTFTAPSPSTARYGTAVY